MSKFNTIVKKVLQTHNHEGAEAFALSPEMELYAAVVTSSLTSKFYETAEQQIDRMSALIGKCDHMFVAQLAVYARTEMNLRSVPLFLIVELARIHSGDNLVGRTIDKVVLRADEIMEEEVMAAAERLEPMEKQAGRYQKTRQTLSSGAGGASARLQPL